MSHKTKHITKTECPHDLRLDFLPQAVGKRFLQYESLTFAFMDKACEAYQGGLWNFYSLSNDGFYLAPDIEGDVHLKWEENYFDGTMSADAAGISISLLAQNALAWEFDPERFSDKYHALLDYAAQHEEAPLIFRFID